MRVRLVWGLLSGSGGVDSSTARRPSRVERGDLVLRHEGPGRRSACSGGLWRVSHGKDHGSSGEPAQATASMLKFTVYGPPASDLVLENLRRPLAPRFGRPKHGTRGGT